MGRVNVCVKRSFIVVASLIAIISVLVLGITLFTHGFLHESEEVEIEKAFLGIHIIYAASIIAIILITTGLYGVCKLKKWMLICYVVGIILGSMLMSVFEILLVALQPKMAEEIREKYITLMPLTNASNTLIEGLDEFQTEFQCCGLDKGYQDWGYNITQGCLCVVDAINPCVAAPRNSSLFENIEITDEPIMIYKDPCMIYLMAHYMFAVHCVLGVVLVILLLWISSVALCIVILHQLNRKEDTPAVVYTPEAKAGNYSVLADDAEFT